MQRAYFAYKRNVQKQIGTKKRETVRAKNLKHAETQFDS